MDIKTEADIDGVAARCLREKAGLSQKDFWTPFGLTQSGGCRYENGSPLPKPVRTIIFLTYVVGLKIDASTDEGVQSLIRLSHLQASERAGEKAVIGEKISRALGHAKAARAELTSI